MNPIKDTKQAQVRIGYDGRVHKYFYGTMARERFENELRVLKYLEEKGCDYVPKIVDHDPDKFYMVTTNCGAIVSKISQPKLKKLFSDLENKFGVRHEDPFMRNVTYDPRKGHFCLIDFEFATILESGLGLQVKQVEEKRLDQQRKQVDND